MNDNVEMYQLWRSRGEGMERGPKFRILADALRYIDSHIHEASYAIRASDGSWYHQPGGNVLFARAAA